MIPSTIAIDGPAASGKSTLGKRLADDLGYLYFDTGIMYRAVTWLALKKEADLGNEGVISSLAELIQIDVRPPSMNDGRDSDVIAQGQDITWEIRKPEVDANVSVVSAYQGVRTALTKQQRRIGKRGRVVMVGRDIGTVVLPDADLKLYVDALVDIRARRRFHERSERGESSSFEKVLEFLKLRDKIDSTRDVAPLSIAEDAIVIDTNELGIDEVYQFARELVGDWSRE